MDKKTEQKLRLRGIRLRTALFFRRNGLYIAAFACLAALGAAAAMIFARPEGDAPVRHSGDERLSDVTTAAPDATPTPGANTPVPMPTFPLRPTVTPPAVQPHTSRTPIPDFTPSPTAEPAPALSHMQPPADGYVIRRFALSSLIWSETLQQWMTHPGVDIAVNKGEPVYAVLAGTVENIYTDDMLGVTVVLAHENGLKSVYSSLKETPPVEIGAHVEERAVIGYIGDTAIGECAERSHLHFELLYDGGPIDPESVIIFNKKQQSTL